MLNDYVSSLFLSLIYKTMFHHNFAFLDNISSSYIIYLIIFVLKKKF